MAGFDGYVVRARLFPAILGVAPAIAFAFANIAVSWERLGLPQVIVSTAVAVLFFGFSDLARRFGRRAEQKMFASTGGRPFPTVLRHRDPILDAKSKAHCHAFLATKLGEKAPSAVVEKNNPEKADAFYVRAGNWLRERTRDQEKFKVLFEENVVYGFRRNLYGLKWFGLGLNLLVVLACLALLYLNGTGMLPQYGIVLVISVLHALYFLFAVSKKSALDASDQYGRQLVLACESLAAE